MKWAEFYQTVLNLLTVDKARKGTEDFLPLLIRAGVRNVQTFVRAYRERHQTIYQFGDFAEDGQTSVGTFPVDMREFLGVQVVWTPDGTNETDYAQRYDADAYPWENRFDLIHGLESVQSQTFRYARDPAWATFLLYPKLSQQDYVLLWWNGIKTEFGDTEETPFDEDVAFAVSLWTLANLARRVDQDIQAYTSFMNDYLHARNTLFIKMNKSKRV